MLKVGRKRKRKERKKERKTKSTQTLLPGFELAHETSPRSQKTKYKTRSISKYYVRNNHATHRLKKKHFSQTKIN